MRRHYPKRQEKLRSPCFPWPCCWHGRRGDDARAIRARRFDPNANGAVRVVVVQPDGKILIGGEFTTVSPNGGGAVTRNHIARLNPDGMLDTAFNPNANGRSMQSRYRRTARFWWAAFSPASADRRAITSPGLMPRPDWLIRSTRTRAVVRAHRGAGGRQDSSGRQFPNHRRQPRNRIARLDPTTGLADSFGPNAKDFVNAIAVQADGKILAGGTFNTLSPNGGGPVTRNRIARLNPDGTLDTVFDPNANGFVRSIVVQADGRILVGGGFLGANGIGERQGNSSSQKWA